MAHEENDFFFSMIKFIYKNISYRLYSGTKLVTLNPKHKVFKILFLWEGPWESYGLFTKIFPPPKKKKIDFTL